MTSRLYDTEIAKILNDKNGMIGRELDKRAKRVELLSKRFVGSKTGKLRKSINRKIKSDARGIYARVGSDLPYALDHHNGTRRHVISAKPGHFLRFPGKGRMVFQESVVHPGTRPNLYLVRALPAAKM